MAADSIFYHIILFQTVIFFVFFNICKVLSLTLDQTGCWDNFPKSTGPGWVIAEVNER